MRSILPAIVLLTGCVTEPIETDTTEAAVRRENGRRARIASSGFSSCAILGGGRVKCFGENTSGQLGDGTQLDRTTPVLVQNLVDVTDIAVTPTRALALTSTGSVRQWGALESGIATTPQLVAGLTDAVEVMGGGGSPCALKSNGTVACWGTLAGTTTTTATPTAVSGLADVASLAKGSAHCAALANGTVKCWGSNTYGQLGNGTQTTSAAAVTVSGISNARAVAGGPHHACALLATGAIKCWGRNHHGQLGNGVTASVSTTPVTVSGISTAKSIAVGLMHSCAVLANGSARCWGMGANGQLGNSNDAAYSTPQVVTGLTNAVELASDTDTTTALLASGGLRAWGRGTHGALGNGGTPETLEPVAVAGLFDKYGGLRVSSGGSHACALLPSGRVKCWGRNDDGQLGNGTTTDSLAPVYFGSFTNVIDVSTQEFSTCVVRADGTVWCAGDSLYVDSPTPVQFSGITNAIAIHTFAGSGCVLLASGSVKCFGLNNDGDSSIATTVPGVTDAVSISVGTDFQCAIRAGGTAHCWGANRWGQLGNGSTVSSDTPVTVRANALSPLTNIVALSAGGARACAVLSSGVVRCWGAGYNGLGTGAPMPENNPYPVAVVGITDAVDVSVGYDNMCAILRGGGVRCWGLGINLGAGVTVDQLAPAVVGGATPITGVTQLASDRGLTCSAHANDTAMCWGSNDYGQLGTGATGPHERLPVAVVGL